MRRDTEYLHHIAAAREIAAAVDAMADRVPGEGDRADGMRIALRAVSAMCRSYAPGIGSDPRDATFGGGL